MLQRRSNSTARPAERPFLAPIWLIALLAAIIGVVLFLIYPRQDLERRIASAPDSAISTAYLDNLLRSDPDNPHLRLLLARRQLQTGDTKKARETLQPALDSNNPELHREALWVLWLLFLPAWKYRQEVYWLATRLKSSNRSQMKCWSGKPLGPNYTSNYQARCMVFGRLVNPSPNFRRTAPRSSSNMPGGKKTKRRISPDPPRPLQHLNNQMRSQDLGGILTQQECPL